MRMYDETLADGPSCASGRMVMRDATYGKGFANPDRGDFALYERRRQDGAKHDQEQDLGSRCSGFERLAGDVGIGVGR